MHLFTVVCGIYLVQLAAGIQSAAVKQDIGVVSASVGDNVTLHCYYRSEVAMHYSWYRQTLGGGLELLSSFYKSYEPSKGFRWLEQNPRYFVQRKEGINHLIISDVHASDSATYFCGSTYYNVATIGEGVFLSVKGANLNTIFQWPVSETIQSGGTVTFNCTIHSVMGACDGEPSVYWFRHGSRQGVLQTGADQCQRHSAPPGRPSQSCVYHLQKVNLSSSDTGIYYCAVASCGEVLFGDGSELKVGGEDRRAHVRTLVWVSITRTVILLFFGIICLLVYVRKSR